MSADQASPPGGDQASAPGGDRGPAGGTPHPPIGDARFGRPRSTGDTPRNRLAAELRRLSGLVVGRPLPDAELEVAAQEAGRLADRLTASARPGKAPRGMSESADLFWGPPQDFFPTSPMFGYANPVAPPVEVWVVRGSDGRPELRGRVTFGYQYEGPPTCVHGGVIAELFDELLGAVNIVVGQAGFTGTLTVRYRRPTPLLVPLDFEARQVRMAGRKIFARGSLSHEGEVTAEADGVFIEVRPRVIVDLISANAEEAEEDVLDAGLEAFVQRGGEILGAEGTLPVRPPPESPPEDQTARSTPSQ